MKKTLFLCCMALILFLSGNAFAWLPTNGGCTNGTCLDFSYQAPSPWTNTSSLDGNYAYQWGIQTNSYFQATSALLKISGLTSITNASVLHVSLLDKNGGFTGMHAYNDGDAPGDYNTTPYDTTTELRLPDATISNTGYSYSFSSSDLSTLQDYLANNNNFAIGLDPDCYYTYTQISLKICGNYTTPPPPSTPVPEPATMALFGLGLVGLAAVSRRRLSGKQETP